MIRFYDLVVGNRPMRHIIHSFGDINVPEGLLRYGVPNVITVSGEREDYGPVIQYNDPGDENDWGVGRPA
jgi:hypothetical protein